MTRDTDAPPLTSAWRKTLPSASARGLSPSTQPELPRAFAVQLEVLRQRLEVEREQREEHARDDGERRLFGRVDIAG